MDSDALCMCWRTSYRCTTGIACFSDSFYPFPQGNRMFPLSPSHGTPGEGWGGGPAPVVARNPHPVPPPEYRRRGKTNRRMNMRLPCPLPWNTTGGGKREHALIAARPDSPYPFHWSDIFHIS
jgi:hypothetical protein